MALIRGDQRERSSNAWQAARIRMRRILVIDDDLHGCLAIIA
jgi:hypothetical protein